MSTDSERATPRVGLLTTELGAGGAEKVVFELANRLSRKRFEVVGVWCLKSADGYYAGELSRVGIPCWGAGARHAGDLLALRALRKQLQAARLDLLNAHLFHAAMAGRLVARRAGVRSLVVTHHFHERRAWRHFAERLWLGRAQAVTAVSRSVANSLAAGLRIAPEEVRVLPNGVDLAAIEAKVPSGRAEARRRLRLPTEARVVGTVGRLSPEKDPLTLLEAFARLAAEDQSLRLIYVGDGPLHEKLFKRIGALGLRERAQIIGFWADVPAALAAMDIFALSSLTEGHPLALLEAMGAGLPVAASRIPAVLEILGPTGEGALTFTAGRPEELATELGKLLKDRDLAARTGSAGKAAVRRNFTVARMIGNYEDLFAELLSLPEEAEEGNSARKDRERRNGLTAPHGRL